MNPTGTAEGLLWHAVGVASPIGSLSGSVQSILELEERKGILGVGLLFVSYRPRLLYHM